MTGDPHLAIDVQVPAGRHQESFYYEQRGKLQFIASYAKENNIGAIVFPGDVLNYKNPSLYTAKSINSLMYELSLLNKAAPVYSISGNHDLKMSSRQMKTESVYNIFTQGKVLKDVHMKTISLGKDATLTGIDYSSNQESLMNEVSNLNERLGKTFMDSYNIVIIHEHLLPDGDELPFCTHINYSEFLQFNNIHCIHAGHLHKGYKTETVSTVDLDSEEDSHSITFVNPWALSRLSRDNYVMSDAHKPEFVVLTVDGDNPDPTQMVSYEHVTIPHRTFKEAFVMEELNSVESRTLDIKDFVDTLQGFENVEEFQIPLDMDLKDQVKERINHYLEKAGG